VSLQSIDPHELFLIKAFQAKASRLGVLCQYYANEDTLRHLLQISLREAWTACRTPTRVERTPHLARHLHR
jgi:hypothetical protein